MTCPTADGAATVKAAGNNAKNSNTLVGSVSVTSTGDMSAATTTAIRVAGIGTETTTAAAARYRPSH